MRKLIIIFLIFASGTFAQSYFVRRNPGAIVRWSATTSLVTSYKIYRSNDNVTFTFLAQVPSNILAYNDASTVRARSYYYVITTYDANYISDGFSGPESTHSNTVLITIP